MSERAAVKRLIDEAARRHLRPMGLRQKGRSRLWFDDRGWSLITVEFQPGFGVGTYLNVAVTWLWYDHGGVWTLDEGGRVWWRDDGEFTTEPPHAPGWQERAQFIREHIFVKEMDIVANVAARCVRHFREQFPDPCGTARYLAARPTRRSEDPAWHAYHTGAAHALCGDREEAREAFARLGSDDRDLDWLHVARQRAAELSLIDSPTELRQRIVEIIESVRRQLGLSPWTPPTTGNGEDVDRPRSA